MARRRTRSLAYCEYVSPNAGNSAQVWQARLLLIDTARRVYPTFLTSLETAVFPFYCELSSTGYDFGQILWVPNDLSPYDLLPESSSLKSALGKWSMKFNAEAEGWILDDALRTLRFWQVAPEERKSHGWFGMHAGSSTASTGQPFTFDCQGWETELLTWAYYSESVRMRFERKLLDYERETRKLAESCGLVRARRKYSPDNFEWFVLYTFAGLSSVEIVRRSENVSSLNESTVLKGIKVAAKLIGWGPLRTSQSKTNRKIR